MVTIYVWSSTEIQSSRLSLTGPCAHQPQSKGWPIFSIRCAGSKTQARDCHGGWWRRCWVWPQESSATQCPSSSWWKPVTVTPGASNLPSGFCSLSDDCFA